MTLYMNEIEIGISVISLLPESWGAAGLLRAGEIAKRLGLSLQLNPLIGYRTHAVARLKENGVKVVSVEYGSWAPTIGSLVRKIAKGDVGAAASPALFGMGNAERSYNDIMGVFPNAIEIDHRDVYRGRGAIETSPNDHTDFSEDDYLNAPSVVFDTWHSREEPAIAKDTMAFARKLVEKGNVKLIHAQTRSAQELSDFCAGRPTQMGALLKVVMAAKVPVVIELDPRHVKKDYAMIECARNQIRSIAQSLT
jgi:hypothetical protein